MEFDFARIVEIAVTAMGLLYLWWEFHANARMWILGIIMPAIDIYLYWNKGVYGNMLMPRELSNQGGPNAVHRLWLQHGSTPDGSSLP